MKYTLLLGVILLGACAQANAAPEPSQWVAIPGSNGSYVLRWHDDSLRAQCWLAHDQLAVVAISCVADRPFNGKR